MVFALLLALAFVASAQPGPRALDSFDTIDNWKAVASDSVSASLRQSDGVQGKALCLDYDFNGVSGYAVARRTLPMTYPANYEFALQLRGEGPVNNLEFKLSDSSGDNVWWVNKPNYPLPREWTPLKLKKRHITFAWGPSEDKTLRKTQTFEITISAGKGGGKGTVCIDELLFRELPVDDTPAPKPVASASTHVADDGAANAVDGDRATAWRVPKRAGQTLTLDLGREREFGGLNLRWRDGEHASVYRIAWSDDGRTWREARKVTLGNGGVDPIALPESEARYLRLILEDGPGTNFGLAEVAIEKLAFAATPNDFIKALAKDAPRGWYPRGFVGEQPYWTIVGVDGGKEQGLIGEDGAIEVAKGGFSIEPFVVSDGKLVTWADVRATQSLQDGYLPILSVEWKHADFGLRITSFGHTSFSGDRSQLHARYRLSNPTISSRDYIFALAVQPFQVNPPSQFLNTVGGVSRIEVLSFEDGIASVAGKQRVYASVSPDAAFATAFDAGMAVSHLAEGTLPDTKRVSDETGLASGAMLYRLHLGPGESKDIDLLIPLTGGAFCEGNTCTADAMQRSVADEWRKELGHVRIRVPEKAQHLVDTLRTALAHMLISRVGPRLQPGTRSYARAWIRDGAMISEGLLRLGREDVAAEFLRWYAPYQFDNGKVPCCVDDRGSDPVPENDSHGELIYAVAELYRYTGDREPLEAMWPHVVGAVKYMDELRLSERTEANRASNPAFYGLMPASISHEGYSAKPMHSYWDDFWALRGYKDAVEIAQWLGRDADADRFAASRDQFRDDLYASLRVATRQRGIDFIPGSAELGDFDATSTTIALAPGGEQGRLPEDLLRNTFERYWKEFVERRDGKREWKDYTPYELRTIGSFIRLGWRDRAHEALDFFFADQQPRTWNQWAEVVSHTPRKPFFLGDLPHAWVESDYVRSALDLFAYERDVDDALVIAAGIPADWLDGEGVAIEGLRTPHGKLGYSLRRTGGKLRLQLSAGLRVPAGGIVLPWPYTGKPGAARIDGAAAQWNNGELRIRASPANVEVELAK
ncbi:discoidin domain-containing protein [Lysobacter sp. CFH 32150]|uniref:discoidin domain-containing protein n=1 Tax=Lysobacter sp. CFH 32150 TaxID=2927128 RepID=UPI001FA800FF|nr:discoidin domain-containing protein [Lysobacter sp. CFH 32150]MCI4567162.1 discoidin domain-containing protein [Lysobacter sp. CFH 32150]